MNASLLFDDIFNSYPFTTSWYDTASSRSSVSDDGTLTLEFDIPGVKPGDVEVTRHDTDKLKIRGKLRGKSFERLYKIAYGHKLDWNTATADVADGVLSLSFKPLADVMPLKIPIKCS